MVRIIQTATFEPRTQNEADWLYNGLDCCVTLEVADKLRDQLDNTTATTYAFSKELQGPVLEMTMRGLLVDQRRRKQVLDKCRSDMTTIADQLDRIIRDGIGLELNWRSPAQLRTLFYEVLGFKPIKSRSANGTYTVSVNREALEKLAANFRAEPICNRLLLLRDLDKKRQFLEAPIDSDGRDRTSFNIGGTDTGRLSSSASDFGTGGNRQNVDRDLREIYIADKGMKFANLDLEQGDSRNVGALCWNLFINQFGEKWAGSYLDACESSDLHTAVARMVWTELEWGDDWRKTAEQLFYRNDSYRQIAKKVGHATNFFGQPPQVSLKTKTDKKLVESFQKRYFTAFPCVRERIRWVDQELLDTSTLYGLFNRRRIFFGRPTDGETRRAAYAYEPQNATAEEINRGLLNLWYDHRVRLHLQVHDSILIQYPEEQEDEIIPWAVEKLRVPLVLAKGREFCVPVDAKVGWNWGEWSEKNVNGLKKFKEHDGRKRLV